MRRGNFFISNKIMLNMIPFLTALVALFLFLICGKAYSMTIGEAFNFYKAQHCSAQVSCQPTLTCDITPPWEVFSLFEQNWKDIDFLPVLFTTTLEAETMIKTTGGAVTGGWSIWSNGNIKSSVNFPHSTIYDFEIIAKGSVAAGIWPNMELRIDEATKATFTVNKSTWDSYKAQVSVPSGLHEVIIAFTNDLKTSTEDRNLYVDKIIITAN